MCRPSANTENSRSTREKPLVPRVHLPHVFCEFFKDAGNNFFSPCWVLLGNNTKIRRLLHRTYTVLLSNKRISSPPHPIVYFTALLSFSLSFSFFFFVFFCFCFCFCFLFCFVLFFLPAADAQLKIVENVGSINPWLSINLVWVFKDSNWYFY